MKMIYGLLQLIITSVAKVLLFYNCWFVSLSVCLLAGLYKYYYLDLPKKKLDAVSNLYPVKFLD